MKDKKNLKSFPNQGKVLENYDQITYAELAEILKLKLIKKEQLVQKMPPLVEQFTPKDYHMIVKYLIHYGIEHINADKLKLEIDKSVKSNAARLKDKARQKYLETINLIDSTIGKNKDIGEED